MKFYLAPLEGVTGYIFRNALEKYFPGTDRYFTPFIVPDSKRTLRTKELRDILPENNHVASLIPQILTNDADRFHEAVQALAEYGYEEVNLNLGCPSGTVVSRKRGAGLLAYPEELDRLLDRIFSENNVKISVKTRIGMEQPEEAYRLMEIYNRYPLSELIIHPRTRQEFYRGVPHLDIFEKLLMQSKTPVCYNGNLLTRQDYEAFCRRFPQVDTVMLGRGVIANPGLIRELSDLGKREEKETDRESMRVFEKETGTEAKRTRGEEKVNGSMNRIQTVSGQETKSDAVRTTQKAELQAFHDQIFAQYREIFDSDVNAMFHMKELWSYLLQLFADSDKHAKKIRKARTLPDYQMEVARLFRECELYEGGTVKWMLPEK